MPEAVDTRSLIQQLFDRAYAFKAPDRLSERAAQELERLLEVNAKLVEENVKLDAENRQLVVERLRAVFASPFSEAT